MRKHLVWFPFLLIALTVIMAVTIVVIDKERGETVQSVSVIKSVEERTQVKGLDKSESRIALADAMTDVWNIADIGEGSVDMVKDTRNKVLNLRVVSEDKDAYILAIVAMNKLISGLNGDSIALAEAQVGFAELNDIAVWMNKKKNLVEQN